MALPLQQQRACDYFLFRGREDLILIHRFFELYEIVNLMSERPCLSLSISSRARALSLRAEESI